MQRRVTVGRKWTSDAHFVADGRRSLELLGKHCEQRARVAWVEVGQHAFGQDECGGLQVWQQFLNVYG